jgi:hypothetical protein
MIKKIIFVILLCISCNMAVVAQNLDLMPIAQRDSLLISIAKEVVLILGPDYYREYKTIVERRYATGSRYPGRVFFRVTFLYDRTQERIGSFAAEVSIWEDTGQLSGVLFGNGMGWSLNRADWYRIPYEVGGTVPYQQIIFPIYDFTDPNPDRVPLNIDELTRLGMVRVHDDFWERTRPDTPPAEAQKVIQRALEELRQRQAERDRKSKKQVKGCNKKK